MFKRYRFMWGGGHKTDFFLRSRRDRRGMRYDATVRGDLPRLDLTDSALGKFASNECKLSKAARYSRRSSGWEVWPGGVCLTILWDRLAALNFVAMKKIRASNPFDSLHEPKHVVLTDPEEVFSKANTNTCPSGVVA